MLPQLMRESLSEYDLDVIIAELIRIYHPDTVISTALIQSARHIENQNVLEILQRLGSER